MKGRGCYPWGSERGVMGVAHLLHIYGGGTFVTPWHICYIFFNLIISKCIFCF